MCIVVFFVAYGFCDAWNDQQQGKRYTCSYQVNLCYCRNKVSDMKTRDRMAKEFGNKQKFDEETTFCHTTP